MKNHITLLISVILLLSIIAPIVSSQNDPGHDTLYIEEQGDSELNGTLNITTNLSVNGGRIKQGGVLTLYADDTLPGTGTYISATSSNNLYLDAQGSLYLKYNIGGDAVYIGNTGTPTNLNVTGALYVQSGTATVGGQGICLANGTNCPGGGAGDISSVQTDNTYVYNGSDTGQVYLLFNETKLNATIDARVISGSGNISGGGTSGTLARFTGEGTIGNSIVSESGNTLTINGNISMPTHFYIGNGATVTNTSSLAIGDQARATGDYATAFGYRSQSTALAAIAIGNTASAEGNYAIAIGQETNASSDGRGIAIGLGATSTGYASTALGNLALATANGAVAVGGSASAEGGGGVAIGDGANASSYGYGTAVGNSALARGSNAVAIGNGGEAGGEATAVGSVASATGATAIAMGWHANASGWGSVAIGQYSNATELTSITLGYEAVATADYATAIGYQAQATAQDALAFGRGVVNNVANSSKFGGAVYVGGNISQNDNLYHCFGNDCDSYIYYNGTSMIIKVT